MHIFPLLACRMDIIRYTVVEVRTSLFTSVWLGGLEEYLINSKILENAWSKTLKGSFNRLHTTKFTGYIPNSLTI